MPASSDPKRVLIYGMGHDGGDALVRVLHGRPDLHVRQIFTLDLDKIDNLKAGRHAGDTPHIADSEAIARNELGGTTPLYIITPVPDPLDRHIRLCTAMLEHSANTETVTQTLYAPTRARAFFDAVAPAHTTEWFSQEYATGLNIDVFADTFDRDKGLRHYTLGPHHILLLSMALSPEAQQEALSTFLGTVTDAPVPIVPDNRQDILTARMIDAQAEHIAVTFWQSAYARHFFTPSQLADFEARAERTRNRVNALPETALATAAAQLREDILQAALSPLSAQASALQEQLAVHLFAYGADKAMPAVEGTLRELDSAYRNLRLAMLRALGQVSTPDAGAFGEKWLADKPDPRFVRSLASLLQRGSALTRPHALLEQLDQSDPRVGQDTAKLAAKALLLERPFAFSPQRPAPAHTPTPRRIIYNAHQCLPFHTSGYATRTHGLVSALHDAGWDIDVFARAGYPRDVKVNTDDLSTRTIDGIRYHFGGPDGVSQFALPIDQYIDRAADYLAAQAVAHNAALIHTASNHVCGMAGVEAARRAGIPSVYEMRGLWHVTRWSKEPDYVYSDQYKLAQKLELETAAAADHVIAITGVLKDWLAEHGIPADKISLAPNAVDLDQFACLPADTTLLDDTDMRGKTVVGYIGSFVEYEGLDILLRGVASLPPAMRASIRLLWVGDGAALPSLIDLAHDLGINDLIVSLGRVPFTDIPRLYSLVDICVFPRKGVPVCEIISPLKPFEAMAMRKAVLVSDVRPLHEIIEDGKTGLIHRKDDAQDLARQLARLVSDADLRQKCSQNAREWIEHTRQWNTIALSVSDVYDRLTR